MSYFICIDGGGTKTKFVLYNHEGKYISSLIKPSCHIMQNTIEKVGQILMDGINTILLDNCIQDKEVVISMGLGGYGSEKNQRKIDLLLQSIFGDKFSYTVTNDAEIALLGAHDGQKGAILISGTGSILLYFDGVRFNRYGGWGYLLGDEGSAYWVGKELLKQFNKEADDLTTKTEIFKLIMNKFSLQNPHDILDSLIDSEGGFRTAVASLAKSTNNLALDGNKDCKDILIKAGEELADLCNSSLGRNINVNLALYGGLWESGDILFNSFLDSKIDSIRLIEPKHDACWGAYILAKKNFY